MKKKGLLRRLLTILLVLSMVFTSQTVMTLTETVVYAQDEGDGQSGEGQGGETIDSQSGSGQGELGGGGNTQGNPPGDDGNVSGNGDGLPDGTGTGDSDIDTGDGLGTGTSDGSSAPAGEIPAGEMTGDGTQEGAEAGETNGVLTYDLDSGDSPYDSVGAMAEDYYGTSASNPQDMAAVEFSKPSGYQFPTTAKAGDTLTYTIRWDTKTAPLYPYKDQALGLFDHYDGTKIYLKLPEGMTISRPDEIIGIESCTYNEDTEEWEFTLNPSITPGNNGSFTINVQVEGNGTLEVGRQFIFSENPSALRIETNVTVLDKTNVSSPATVGTYSQKKDSANLPDTVTSVSDDVWGIAKTYQSHTTAGTGADEKVTVRYKLEMGLLSDGTIVTNPSSYAVNGRVPLDSVKLTETLGELLNRDDEVISAEKVTVTPDFGSRTPVEYSENLGQPIVLENLTLDTCAAHADTVGIAVAGTAPYYTVYYVDVVYPYADFIANYYDEKQEKLTVSNTAQISYVRKGESEAKTAESSDSEEIGEVTKPAELEIRKFIQSYSGDGKQLYASGTDWSPISGAAEFSVTKEDGTAALLYQKNADGTYTVLSEDGKVSITPDGDGKAVVYLDAGTYKVKEISAPYNTDLEAGEKEAVTEIGKKVSVDFTNKEKLGAISITKTGIKDGSTSPLNGAEFGLYTDKNCTQGGEIATAVTAGSGTAQFTRLTPGTYYIKEISAPEGYLPDDEIHEVTVEANQTETVELNNQYNAAHVRLQKQYWVYLSNAYANVNSTNYQEFSGCFSIEQSTDGGQNWTEVEGKTGLSLTSSGQINSELPVYAADGTLITYRFKETLPEGWHGGDDSQENNGVCYSPSFTLEEKLSGSQENPHTVTMQNIRNGSLTLTKQFVRINPTTGAQVTSFAAKGQATFDLYRKVGESGDYEKVGAYQTDASGKITVTNLERISGSDTIYYYWVETSHTAGDGYVMETTEETEEIQVDGGNVTAIGPYYFTADDEGKITLDQSMTVKNVQQKVAVKVTKTDAYTNNFISGAKITIEKVTGSGKEPVIENADVPGTQNGYVAVLEPGYKYEITETQAPANYIQSTTPQTVDFTGVTKVTSDTPADSLLKTVNFVNTPYPKVQINKTVTGVSGTSPLTGVTFEVYTKGEDDTFTPVKKADGTNLSIVPGTQVPLQAGTYYLREVIPDSLSGSVLDPEKYSALYGGIGSDKYEIATDGKFYFGPYTVEQRETVNHLGIIDNISNLGGLTVKKTDGTNPLSGAEIGVYTKDSAGEETLVKSSTTTTTGELTFTDLPIYDASGLKITYYIREITPPEGYYGSGKEIETTLVPKQITSTVNGGGSELLTIVNSQYTTFTVTKEYRDLWEYTFNGKAQLIEGAEIALYEWDEENGYYTYVETKTTGPTGEVEFERLTNEGTYVAVEVSVPDTGEQMEPAMGGNYLNPQEYPTLTEDELADYNYCKKEPNTGASEDVLVNQKGWTQIWVYKWKNNPSWTEGMTEEPETIPQNGALFDLYQQILPEDTEEDAVLTFDADNCTLIGSYSSGTLPGEDGERQAGWLATDILDTGDNIVYWMVETEAGPGAKIIDAENYILFKRNGTQYTNNSNGGNSTKVCDYLNQQVTNYKWENEPVTGPGPAYMADVSLAKWAGELTEDGDKKKDSYSALGNAKYELWVVNSAGEYIQKVDDLTVGLENDLGDTSGQTGEKTAYAISNTLYYFSEVEGKINYADFNAKEAEGNREDITWGEDDQGQIVDDDAKDADSYYVRMAIREVYAPFGYQMDSRAYYMIVKFGNTSNGGMCNNNAYYVTDSTDNVTLADELPEDKITWAEYYKEGDTQYRLVNWPIDNYSVTINKYGYTPDENTLGLTSDELDSWFEEQGHSGRIALGGVTMKLQRYNPDTDAYEDYDYEKLDWGTKTFETSSTGKMSFPNGLRTGRYRIIETAGSNTAYELLYDGKTVDGLVAARYFKVGNDSVTVSMYNPAKLSLSLKKEDLEGTAVSGYNFTLHKKGESGTYESTTEANGIAQFDYVDSGTYWMSESGSGYSSAYLEEYIEATYPKLTAFVQESEGIFLGYTRKMADTADGEREVVLTEITDLSDYTDDASVVAVKNPPEVSLTVKKTDEESGKALEGAAFTVYYQPFDVFRETYTVKDMTQEANRTWLETNTTGADGTFTVSAKTPGVYYIVETKAPQGYDAVLTGTVIALTGGMHIEVTGADETYTSAGNTTVTFTNKAQAKLTVTKVIDAGSLTAPDAYEAEFSLYESKEAQTALDTKKATQDTEAVFTGLHQGQTYYLGETANSKYAIRSVNVGGTDVQPENGRYPVKIDGSDVKVTVTNRWLYAQVTVLKVDGSNGTALTGAEFEVQKDGVKVQGVQWTEKDGTYTALIPLDSKDGGIYHIIETKAPEHYIQSGEPIEVALQPGEKKAAGTWSQSMTEKEMRNNLIMPNDNGILVEVTKYDNMKEAQSKAKLSDVTFRMYEKSGDTWQLYDTKSTDADGNVEFTLSSGMEYALGEAQVSGYVGLQGIWQGETALATEEAAGQTLCVLDTTAMQPGQTYAFSAYNIPEVELEVRKADALGGTDPLPEANFSVYEVPADTKETLTADEVAALQTTGTPVRTERTTKTGSGYTYMDGIPVEPGKTYLIAENEVTGREGYDTFIRDDNRVKWYQVLTIPAGTKEKQIVTLENVLGEVTLALNKTAEKTTLNSLFDGEQTLTYTLSPEIENTYGLDGFVLEDVGLSAFDSQNRELNFDTYLKEKYTVTQVKLGKTSHDVTMYDGCKENPAANVISADVTFYDFTGQKAYERTGVIVSAGEQTVSVPANVTAKIKNVSIRYYSTGLVTAAGYALGQNFTPGEVQVGVRLDQQKGGADSEEIAGIRNDAKATVTYKEWDSAGVQTQAATDIESADDVMVSVDLQEAPTITVEKSAGEAVTSLNDTLTYTLTLKNTSANGQDLLEPFIVDLLPEGTTVDTNSTFARMADSDTSGLAIGEISTQAVGEGTAVVIHFLKEEDFGSLEAGKQIAVELDVKVNNSVVSHGNTMTNYVFAGSDYRGVQTQKNPNAASFKNENGSWAESIDTVAASSGLSAERTKLLQAALIQMGMGGYGFISDSAASEWYSGSGMTLVKEVKGSMDDNYSSSKLAQAENGGEVNYRLTVSNTDGAENRTNLTVLDVLPQEGDTLMSGTGRYSAWNVYLTDIISVSAGGSAVAEDAYKVYYYTGDIAALDYDAVKDAQGGCPAGWQEASAVSDKHKVTAFILAFDTSVVLKVHESLVIEYAGEATTDAGTGTYGPYPADELADIAYLNAVNNFVCHYSNFPSENGKPEDAVAASNPSESTSVSVTVTPGVVKVGGHVWIDVDGDGIRETEDGIAQFADYAIVKEMLDEIEIQLNTYTDKTSGREQVPTNTTLYTQSGNTGWYTDANYTFENLSAGMLTDDEGNCYQDGELIVEKLKGTNPSTYTITATLPSGEVTGKFALTQSNGSGWSRSPATIAAEHPDETADSNFTRTSTGQNMSERFYLWPAEPDIYDNTKDIGLVLYRNLQLTKTAADDSDAKIEGAEFTIYRVDEYDADGNPVNYVNNEVGTYTTDANGLATAENLYWFKEYVIKETKAADGYDIQGAEAAGANIESLGEGTWLLKVPDKTSMVVTDTMTVTNVRTVQAQIEASKNLTGKPLTAGMFEFELLDEDGSTVLAAAKNGADGKVTFDVEIEGAGETTYYIREKRPADNPSQGMTYDTAVYRAVVKTQWDTADKALEVTGITYYKGNATDPAAGGAVFTNTYEAAGSWTPEATKTLNGRDMQSGETFTFAVTEEHAGGTETVSTGSVSQLKDKAAGAVVFTPITYDLDDVGEHIYTIKETGTAGVSVSLDTNEYEVKVTVADKGDGTLQVTAEQTDGEAAFVNTYTPEPVKYQPAVKKTVSGVSVPADQVQTFQFTLEQAAGNPAGAVKVGEKILGAGEILTTEVTGTGTGAFEEMTFTKAGTYGFLIRETQKAMEGYQSDTGTWTLTVQVEDDPQTGTLSIASIAYTKSGGSPEGSQNSQTEAEFVNSYSVQGTAYAPQVKKTVNGNPPSDETFTFTLSPSDTNPQGAVLPNPATTSVTGNGTAAFGEIQFTVAGEYQFHIGEVRGSEPGYSYDGETWTLKVTVNDTGGKLTVTNTTYSRREVTSQTEAEFINSYSTTEAGYTPQVTKAFSGMDRPDNKTFAFTLEADEKNPQGAVLGNTNASIQGAGTVGFGKITFTEAGEYHFTIRETEGTEPGYSYDKGVWDLKVVVEDKDSILAVTEHVYTKDTDSNDSAAVFTNDYKVKETAYTPKVKKTITGDEVPADQTKEFTFTLQAGANNPAGGVAVDGAAFDASAAMETKVSGAAEASFAEMTFKKAGTYVFAITEKEESASGYSYDKSAWTLTVQVEDKDSQLTVTSHQYVGPAGLNSDAQAAFTNTYRVQPTEYTPKVKKTITGDEVPADQTKKFTFTLQADTGNPAGGVSAQGAAFDAGAKMETEVTGAAEKAFDKLTFLKAGTYTFTLSESDGKEPGYDYDKETWTLTVTVKDNQGRLYVDNSATAYTRQTETNRDMAVFTNTYSVAEAVYAPKVKKTVTGDAPQTREFLFTLEASETYAEDVVKMPESKQLYVAAGTSGTFGGITFYEPGEYTFLLRESDTHLAGYDYDARTWTLTVNVKDTGGKLEVYPSYVQEKTGTASDTEAEFTNDYNPQETKVSPRILKRLKGDDIPEDQQKKFTFTLTALKDNPKGASLAAGDSVEESRTGAGEVLFDDITFTETGEYHFLIEEEKGNEAGYIYDTSRWTLTVVVTEFDGKLAASVTYSKSDDENSAQTITDKEKATFTNTYKIRKGASDTPDVKKNVTGEPTAGAVQTGDGEDSAGRYVFPLAVSAAAILLLGRRRRRKRR